MQRPTGARNSSLARLRTLAATGACAVGALVLSSCGTGGPGSGGSSKSITELDYYTDAAGTKAWGKVLDACSKETGVKIKRQSVPAAQLLPKILQQASSQKLPNLFFLDNPNLQQVASTGGLVPLTKFGISTKGYYDSILKAGTHDGKVYGLAPGVNALALFYNKDILRQKGIEPPKTWEELQTAAQKLSSGDRYGLAFSAVPTEEGTWQFLPAFWGNGADLSALDSPEAEKALQSWTKLVSSGAASKSVVSWNQNDVNDQFMSGNAAMMVNGPWNLPMLDEKSSLHYGIVPLPGQKAGQKPIVPLGGEVGAIGRSNPDAEKASAKVLECILSEKQMLSWDKMHAYVPSRQSTAQKFADDTPQMRSFVEEVGTARSRTAELGSKYADVSASLGKAVQASISGGKSPADALANAQKQGAAGDE